MPDAVKPTRVSCPYCGEGFETLLDSPEEGMQYIEDCPVCCQPIEFRVGVGPGGEFTVHTAREND